MKPRRAIYALPVFQRAQTRAASEMCDDDPSRGNLRRHFRQNGSYVFVGQTMESISLQARFANLSWKRYQLLRPANAR